MASEERAVDSGAGRLSPEGDDAIAETTGVIVGRSPSDIRQPFYRVPGCGTIANLLDVLQVSRGLPASVRGADFTAITAIDAGLKSAMLWHRKSVRGQSLYIAIGKMLGTGASVPDVHMHYVFSPLVWFLGGVIFATELTYTVLVYRQCRTEGIDPWRRF